MTFTYGLSRPYLSPPEKLENGDGPEWQLDSGQYLGFSQVRRACGSAFFWGGLGRDVGDNSAIGRAWVFVAGLLFPVGMSVSGPHLPPRL
jgi:hypothetical protein